MTFSTRTITLFALAGIFAKGPKTVSVASPGPNVSIEIVEAPGARIVSQLRHVHLILFFHKGLLNMYYQKDCFLMLFDSLKISF